MITYPYRILLQAVPPPRQYWGDRWASAVIIWLNSTQSTQSYKRVTNFISDLRGAARIAKSIGAVKRTNEPVFNRVTEKEFVRCLSRINHRLERYKVTPQVYRLGFGPAGRWDRQWMTTGRFKGAEIYRDLGHKATVGGDEGNKVVKSPLRVTIDESDTVLNLLTLFEEESLDRVRQCEQCQSWFFARFHRQRFCHHSCQQKFFRASEEWRAQQREYMRRYRRLQRSGKVK